MTTKTYANIGACRRAAKAALGTDAVRGTDFDMRVDESGRWVWYAITEKAPETLDLLSDEGEVAAPAPRTREDWLRELVQRLHAEVFMTRLVEQNISVDLPQNRVSCSFPGGGTARKRIGECWSSKSSADGTIEMMVSPVLDDPIVVAATVAHEMCHMYLPDDVGHKHPFKNLATAIGLEGKMTATEAGADFVAAVQPLLDDMGVYPHAALSLAGRKKKKTYLLKVECNDLDCGCVFRITQKFVALGEGVMYCPVCKGETTVS